jgi:glycolate oxidase FAD binding subunit
METETLRSETPSSAEDAAELLRACAGEGVAVRIAGGATKPWGHPGDDCGVLLQTSALDAIVEHNAGDLTAVLQAGVSLRALDEQLAQAGQMFALDPPLGPADAATVGGAIAAGDSGPLRHRHGAARDLVLGVTVALSDGSVAQAGGRVIKNVAGYDLAKLFSGSFGTLGLITQVAVRLHPRPRARATATGATDDPARLQQAALAMAASSLEAQALDVRWEAGEGLVLARFAGIAAAEQAAAAERLLAGIGVHAEIVDDDEPLWDAQRAAQRSASPGEGAVVRVSGRPTQLRDACAAAGAAGATLAGRAALGLWWIALAPAAPGELVSAVARLRDALRPSPCVVLDAPPPVRANLDPWDQAETAALVLMRRVKQRFDPTATCNPGIYAGAI